MCVCVCFGVDLLTCTYLGTQYHKQIHTHTHTCTQTQTHAHKSHTGQEQRGIPLGGISHLWSCDTHSHTLTHTHNSVTLTCVTQILQINRARAARHSLRWHLSLMESRPALWLCAFGAFLTAAPTRGSIGGQSDGHCCEGGHG